MMAFGYSRTCRCLPGFQYSDRDCSRFQGCGGFFQAAASLVFTPPCDCLRWTSEDPGYCLPLLEAATVADSQQLPPEVASGGADQDLTLSFSLKDGATEVKIYLLSSQGAKEIFNGTQVTLLQNGSEVELRLSSVSPDWAGKYICRYLYENAMHELTREVIVPLGAADLIQTRSQLSMNCSSPEGLTLQCCVRNRGGELRASWNPGAPDPVRLGGNGDPLCHFLALSSCPSADTAYQCTFESDRLGTVQTTVSVGPIQAGDRFCPGENSTGRWDATKAGQVAELLCPEGTDGKMLRSCSPGGTWENVQDNCTNHQLLSGLHEAQLLQAGLGSPQTEVPWMIDWLKAETESGNIQGKNPRDLLAVLDTMDIISEVALGAQMRLESSVVANLLAAANTILDVDPGPEWSVVEALSPSAASRLLQSIENLASLLLPPSGSPYNLTLPNLELQSAQMGPEFEDFNKGFDTDPPLRIHIEEEELLRCGQNVTVTSLVLKKLGRIMPGSRGAKARLGSLVMSNSVTASNGSVSQVEVQMTFGHWNGTGEGQEEEDEEERVAQCVFWDHSLHGRVGGWSAEGCQTSGAETATKCTCRHLTSFSILMSAHPVPDSFALTFLGTFGVCASILALIATLAIYYLVWTSVVKNKVAYFRYTTLVNIALSLLMGSFWFLGASRLASDPESKLCVAAAFFTHFCYLAMFFWMLVQALMLFHQLVFVFHQLSTRSALPAMVSLGYLCPFAIAVATVAAFLPRGGYLHQAVCWLSSRSKAIYAFSVPVLAVVSANALILFVVLLKLMRPSVSEGPQGEEWKALVSIFKALLILTPAFGLTWGLGVITMTSEASQFTHYMFTILNSLQGVFILIFGCLMDKKVRGALCKRLCKSPAAQTKSETLDSKLSN
ncbi:adhesion G-protein coupled receptor F3 isoform X2 [Podarcis muralis]